MSSVFATWEWIRASGITSYLLLFFSILAGMLNRAKMVPKKHIGHLLIFHQTTGWFGFLLGLLHAMFTVMDDYVTYSLFYLFIPFTAEHKPLLSGFGTIALYSIFVLLLTSDLIKKIGRKVWVRVHIIAFPGFILAFVHGVFLGTDSSTILMISFYTATSAVILSVFMLSRFANK